MGRLNIKPDYSHRPAGKAKSLAELGKYQMAVECYSSLSMLSPDPSWIWYEAGNLLLGMRQYGPAVDAYDRAIAGESQDRRCIGGAKGLTLASMRRSEEAIECTIKP